jgi:hypothetical protein
MGNIYGQEVIGPNANPIDPTFSPRSQHATLLSSTS